MNVRCRCARLECCPSWTNRLSETPAEIGQSNVMRRPARPALRSARTGSLVDDQTSRRGAVRHSAQISWARHCRVDGRRRSDSLYIERAMGRRAGWRDDHGNIEPRIERRRAIDQPRLERELEFVAASSTRVVKIALAVRMFLNPLEVPKDVHDSVRTASTDLLSRALCVAPAATARDRIGDRSECLSIGSVRH